MRKKKQVAIYARVSTNDQDTAAQVTELVEYVQKRGWAYTVHSDRGQSGAKEKRPALDSLLVDCQRRRIDVVLVWSLDRLARSLRQLLDLLETFNRLGIDFVSLKQGIDTTSPAGRLTYQVLGAVAEFEREMLRERVKAGIEQARRQGRKLGRHPLRSFSGCEVNQITRAKARGASVRKLATEYHTTQWMVGKILAGKYAASK